VSEPKIPAHFVIDGLNVCNWHKPQPLLYPVLQLMMSLQAEGCTFTCIFDAVTPHRLGETDRRRYEQLVMSSCFNEITGGIRADDFILSVADARKCAVISNDRFRDYMVRYPWLESDPNRLVKGGYVGLELVVPSLHLGRMLIPPADAVDWRESLADDFVTKLGKK
jgi:hypothetical protein